MFEKLKMNASLAKAFHIFIFKPLAKANGNDKVTTFSFIAVPFMGRTEESGIRL